jgi:hypothetical protein
MFAPHCLAILLVGSTCHVTLAVDPKPKLSENELRIEARYCVNMLYQFAIINKDFFPDGPEKPNQGNVGEGWPPPPSYSWRVTILTWLEQNVLYRQMMTATKQFAIPGTISDDQLDKIVDLKRCVNQMPEWLTLERWRKKKGLTVYRRVVVPDQPNKFIVVESTKLVPWHRSGDELIVMYDLPLPEELGGNFPNGFFALCGDRKVRFIPRSLSEKRIQTILIAGGIVPAISADEIGRDIAKLDFRTKE